MDYKKTLLTLMWWIHGAIRFLLAVTLLYNGAIKLGLGQFGIPDMGDALISQGEMSPMGLLSRMVAFSPLFQFLAGVSEVGAAVALIWRRTIVLGGMIGVASMAFIFVLNLGYDMPGKQISLALLIMSAIVILPWMTRLTKALVGNGHISAVTTPTLIPWPKFSRVTRIGGPITGVVILGLVAWFSLTTQPVREINESAPAGVWVVQEDTETPAAQLSEDKRWQKIAFGDVEKNGTANVQVRIADGSLLEGTYQRVGAETIQLKLRELRKPGKKIVDYYSMPEQNIELVFQEQPDGTIRLSGEDKNMVIVTDYDARLLYDRGFNWGIRVDDPFER